MREKINVYVLSGNGKEEYYIDLEFLNEEKTKK